MEAERRVRKDLHDCPGGCGKRVGRQAFSCSVCWQRLPKAYHDAILLAFATRDESEGHRRKHLDAVAAASRWLRGRCCDMHNEHCEPSSDLCCHECTEVGHPAHADRRACVLVPPRV
jgi:hypothetical protein